MRKARRKTLSLTGIAHKMWQGHNRESVLGTDIEKANYLESLNETYVGEIAELVEFNSFCLMGNHPHETNSLRRDSDGTLQSAIRAYSNWMRNAHSRYGAWYNRRHNRKGKVSCERPKTQEVAEGGELLQVMFYGDANPVKAGKVSHPSRYKYSTYQLYAFGKRSKFTRQITAPKEYLALGKTPAQRQRKYRQLCDAYLRDQGLIDDAPDETAHCENTANTTQQENSISWTSTSCINPRGDPFGG